LEGRKRQAAGRKVLFKGGEIKESVTYGKAKYARDERGRKISEGGIPYDERLREGRRDNHRGEESHEKKQKAVSKQQERPDETLKEKGYQKKGGLSRPVPGRWGKHKGRVTKGQVSTGGLSGAERSSHESIGSLRRKVY